MNDRKSLHAIASWLALAGIGCRWLATWTGSGTGEGAEKPMLPKHRPPTHPGEMLLKEFLEPSGVTQAEAAKRIGVPFQRLNAIVRGRRAVSADTAIRLEALTRMDAVFWLRLQSDWDLWHAQRGRRRPLRVKPLAAPA